MDKSQNFQKRISLPFHSLVISIYLVLALFALNVDQIRLASALRALALVPLITLGMWIVVAVLVKNWQRAAILITLLLLLFFSYGHIYHYLEANPILGFNFGRHRILMVVNLVLVGFSVWLALYRIRNLTIVTQMLNLVALVLLMFPVFQISIFFLAQVKTGRLPEAIVDASGEMQVHALPDSPDVYYIVLDGYSREDVLKARFDFDNSAFASSLRELGFYVAICSQSNYTQTILSMASSLNMDYLEALPGGNLESNDLASLYSLLQHNNIYSTFDQMGYTTVAFETSYYWLNIETADQYYSTSTRAVNPGEARLPVNGFEAMLIRESAGLLLTDLLSFLPGEIQPDLEYPNRMHAEQVLYTFEKLADLPLEVPGQKFVYAHIVAPHSPIVFGPDGEWVVLPDGLDDAGWRKAHTDEIQYVNTRVLQLVDELIHASARDPVIILQADHGAMISDQQNHYEILNAYYLPGSNADDLYPAISPVNTFRVILNRYFGGSYPLLDDLTYVSLYDQPFEFDLVDNACP